MQYVTTNIFEEIGIWGIEMEVDGFFCHWSGRVNAYVLSWCTVVSDIFQIIQVGRG